MLLCKVLSIRDLRIVAQDLNLTMQDVFALQLDDAIGYYENRKQFNVGEMVRYQWELFLDNQIRWLKNFADEPIQPHKDFDV